MSIQPASSSTENQNDLSNSFASPIVTVAPSVPLNPSSLSPSDDDIEELLLDGRYGEIDAVRTFVEKFGVEALANACDERGNNVLHMCAANSHDDILAYILSLPCLPPSLLTSGNDSGNTPLHWACLNAQLSCVKRLVNFTLTSSSDQISPNDEARTLGPALILARNNAGHTPLGEAELNGWGEGARWLVSVMDLQLAPESSSAVEVEGEGEEIADERGDAQKDSVKADGMNKENGNQPVETELARLCVSEEGSKESRS